MTNTFKKIPAKNLNNNRLFYLSKQVYKKGGAFLQVQLKILNGVRFEYKGNLGPKVLKVVIFRNMRSSFRDDDTVNKNNIGVFVLDEMFFINKLHPFIKDSLCINKGIFQYAVVMYFCREGIKFCCVVGLMSNY